VSSLTVVTGASGFLGGVLVRTLLGEGRTVRGVDLHRGASLDGLDIEWATADVLDTARLEPALDGATTVFHTAAMISVTGDPTGRVWDVNVNGVRNVAEVALACGVDRLVHCSSVHSYDLETEGEITESSPHATAENLPAYDRSKAAGEAALQEVIAQGLDAVICNPTGIIGPDDFAPSRMGLVLLAMFRGKLPALVDGGFNWVDVRDVAAGLLKAESRGITGENYLLPGHYRTMAEIAGVAEDVSGVRKPRFTAPMWMARAVSPIGNIVGGHTANPLWATSESLHALRFSPPVSGAKAGVALGYRPRSFDTTIEDTYRSFQEQGLLPRPGDNPPATKSA
jgi:dihydroflavonol-4-reductase